MKRIKIGILAAAVIFLVFLSNLGVWTNRTVLEEQDTTERKIAVQIETVRQASESIEARVELFKREADGHYYLFLPSAADRNRQFLLLTGYPSVTIEGEELHNGDGISLQPGKYILELADHTEETLIVMQSEAIGSIFVETESGGLDYLMESKENREKGQILVLDEDMEVLYKGELEFIKGRGNSSWSVTKPAFRLKMDQKMDVYGMGASRNWNMVPNAEDPSMLRNAVMYSWAAKAGLSYSPDYRMVDWYINGDYRGTYQIVESIGVEAERVAIEDLEKQTEAVNQEQLVKYGRSSITEDDEDLLRWYDIPENPLDISGGYLLEQEISDRYDVDEISCGFLSQRNQNVVLKSPKYASREQIEYISDLYQQMEDAVFSENGYNMETGLHYSDYIDIDSFARKYLVEEISKNLDAASTSQFFYKDSNTVSTKIFAGPVWDYDKSLGNGGVRDNKYFLEEPQDLYAAVAPGNGVLWKGLYAQPDFQEYMKKVFRENFMSTLEDMNLQITEESAQIRSSAFMNACRWNVFPEAADMRQIEAQYQQAVEEMRVFLNERCAWLNAYWK